MDAENLETEADTELPAGSELPFWPPQSDVMIFRINNSPESATSCTEDQCSCESSSIMNILEQFCTALKQVAECRTKMCARTIAKYLKADDFRVYFTWLELGGNFDFHKMDDNSTASDSQNKQSRSSSEKSVNNSSLHPPTSPPSASTSMQASQTFAGLLINKRTFDHVKKQTNVGLNVEASASDNGEINVDDKMIECLDDIGMDMDVPQVNVTEPNAEGDVTRRDLVALVENSTTEDIYKDHQSLSAAVDDNSNNSTSVQLNPVVAAEKTDIEIESRIIDIMAEIKRDMRNHVKGHRNDVSTNESDPCTGIKRNKINRPAPASIKKARLERSQRCQPTQNTPSNSIELDSGTNKAVNLASTEASVCGNLEDSEVHLSPNSNDISKPGELPPLDIEIEILDSDSDNESSSEPGSSEKANPEQLPRKRQTGGNDAKKPPQSGIHIDLHKTKIIPNFLNTPILTEADICGNTIYRERLPTPPPVAIVKLEIDPCTVASSLIDESSHLSNESGETVCLHPASNPTNENANELASEYTMSPARGNFEGGRKTEFTRTSAADNVPINCSQNELDRDHNENLARSRSTSPGRNAMRQERNVVTFPRSKPNSKAYADGEIRMVAGQTSNSDTACTWFKNTTYSPNKEIPPEYRYSGIPPLIPSSKISPVSDSYSPSRASNRSENRGDAQVRNSSFDSSGDRQRGNGRRYDGPSFRGGRGRSRGGYESSSTRLKHSSGSSGDTYNSGNYTRGRSSRSDRGGRGRSDWNDRGMSRPNVEEREREHDAGRHRQWDSRRRDADSHHDYQNTDRYYSEGSRRSKPDDRNSRW